MELCTNENLKAQRGLAAVLLGTRKGNKNGIDMFFVPTYYVHLSLNTYSAFYKEAIKGMSLLELKKKVCKKEDEHIFYNRAIRMKNTNKLLIPNDAPSIKFDKIGPLLKENENRQKGLEFNKNLMSLFD